MTGSLLVTDRIITRPWELDLASAGSVSPPKKRPANRKRQHIARFVGREGTIERFEIRQTIPYCGHEVFCPPTQAQYGAVMDFFLECCESRYQANTLLSARDYAKAIAKSHPFTAPRKQLLWLSITAYILASKEMRSLTRAWNIAHRDTIPALSKGAHLRCYKKAAKFASQLIDDMRGAGSEVFG